MDCQVTFSKDAVIESMTRYMTKSGQGALIKVMEHSFALSWHWRCHAAGFNLQSITEVKSRAKTKDKQRD